MDKKEIAKFIGKRIVTARESKEYSQKHLAKMLDVNQTRLSNWEIGEVPAPVEFIPELARILEVSADYLLGLSQDGNGDIVLDIDRENLINRIKFADRDDIDRITKILDIVSEDKKEPSDAEAL